MGATCENHDNMLPKAEFRWVFGLSMVVLISALSVIWNGSASEDQINAVNEKIEYRDKAAESRADRVEKMIETLASKLDKVDELLRNRR